MREIQLSIDSEWITLGQALKMADVIQSGGMAKWYLANHPVWINDEKEDRRGKKLSSHDRVRGKDFLITIREVAKEDS
ncbi:RNA-binding S4 domain-containing protein [Ferroacidibacillus organovorans]|uniref:Uncharacterized protein n=1 Tax=Ferroacidibacillus organovorans TaxID=1765683 RepID=A0A162TGR8_9BACL|nr:RNA-binding S4 domain-containing protein [Ferroacidibacillus organovorans]KYP80788.1 hypothetical protein AYJ22_09930 [Ferroacidibacillus organovorans]OAG93570.1 hypothetical protein AYW79_10085 [Ferroacidibacillus organovorans]OPG16823.1 hypothetical protein B2M26_04800 [Ferroacidibacillus organovorans]